MDERLRERRLLGRAGFGARPGEVDALRREGAEAWLARQFAAPWDAGLEPRLAGFPSLRETSWEALVDLEIPPPEARDPQARRRLARRAREIAREATGARLVRAVHGRFGLREVMLDFWSNHFSVFGRKSLVGALLPHYQREVLEPHLLGRFEDLLMAVAKSSAMLVYLDNWTSTTPELPRWARRLAHGRGGLNENYARELLELHTLGVDGGYDQRDVNEVARVFSGWTLESRRRPVFRFRALLHVTGPKRVLGERVPGFGLEEGEALLRRLARHPATARHLARKLAMRLVADAPPPRLLERASRRFLESEGEIAELLRAILLAPEFADPERRKLKTPLRLAASALRATDGETDGGPALLRAVGRLGELPYFARTPAGYPEAGEHWIDPGAMLQRMALGFALASGRVRGSALGSVLPETLPRLPEARGLGLREAQALAIASPEFQWV